VAIPTTTLPVYPLFDSSNKLYKDDTSTCIHRAESGVSELEVFALVYALEHFQVYLLGSKVTLPELVHRLAQAMSFTVLCFCSRTAPNSCSLASVHRISGLSICSAGAELLI